MTVDSRLIWREPMPSVLIGGFRDLGLAIYKDEGNIRDKSVIL